MGISVSLVDEQHKAEQHVHDPKQWLTSLAMDQWPHMDGSVCLRFIDPWGDTVFNQAQVPFLLAELELSAASQHDPEVRAHLQEVCRLVAAAQDSVHMYVKFIGD